MAARYTSQHRFESPSCASSELSQLFPLTAFIATMPIPGATSDQPVELVFVHVHSPVGHNACDYFADGTKRSISSIHAFRFRNKHCVTIDHALFLELLHRCSNIPQQECNDHPTEVSSTCSLLVPAKLVDHFLRDPGSGRHSLPIWEPRRSDRLFFESAVVHDKLSSRGWKSNTSRQSSIRLFAVVCLFQCHFALVSWHLSPT